MVRRKTYEEVAKSDLLHGYATAANENAEKFVTGLVSNLEHARAAGEALYNAKGLAGHKNWTKWLFENFKQSPETARLYIRIYLHWDVPLFVAAREETDAIRNINGVIKLISNSKDALEELPDENADHLTYLLWNYVEKKVNKLSESDLQLFAKNLPKNSWENFLEAARDESACRELTTEEYILSLYEDKIVFWADNNLGPDYLTACEWYQKQHPGTCIPKISEHDIQKLILQNFDHLWRQMMRGVVRLHVEQIAEKEKLNAAHLDDPEWQAEKTQTNCQLTEEELDAAHLADPEWQAVLAGEPFQPHSNSHKEHDGWD